MFSLIQHGNERLIEPYNENSEEMVTVSFLEPTDTVTSKIANLLKRLPAGRINRGLISLGGPTWQAPLSFVISGVFAPAQQENTLAVRVKDAGTGFPPIGPSAFANSVIH